MPLPECAGAVLTGIADTLYPPPLGPPHAPDVKLSSLPKYIDSIITAINSLPDHEVLETSLLLRALNTSVGTALIFRSPTLTAFADLPLETRTSMLNSLKNSSIADFRKVFNGLKRITMGTALSYSILSEEEVLAKAGSVKPSDINPMWESLSYPGPPICQANHDPTITKPYVFPSKHTTTQYDYVIIGSGSGGGVAGHTILNENPNAKVLIIEKGSAVQNDKVTQIESHGMGNYYEKKSLLTTSDGHLMILAGSCLGGGSSINWGCSLDTPGYVRDEWAGELGLTQFKDKEYDECMTYVKNTMSVHSDVAHNGMNVRLIEGSEKLGWKWKICPQNVKDTATTSAGWTCFGTRQGNKQGGVNTWLRSYCDAGGEITYGDVMTVSKKGRKVRVKIDGEMVEFTAAKAVIVSAGSLCTPPLLQRSGFVNSNIGENLRLHPVTGVMAECDETVDGYCSAPMTAATTEFEMGVKNDGYGYKLECPSVHTGVMAAALPWIDAEVFKGGLQRSKNLTSVIVLQRDIGGGKVSNSKDGFTPKVDYVTNAADSANVLHGMKRAFDILRNVKGVKRIMTLHPSQKIFEVGKDDPEEYYASIDRLGTQINGLGMFCAHQMGSCRMGVSPTKGAVDCDGELWEGEGVYVMDASVFPTASGANPMISTMAISRMLSRRLVRSHMGGGNGNNTLRAERRRQFKGREAGNNGFLLGMNFTTIAVGWLGLAGGIAGWMLAKNNGLLTN